MDNKISFVCCIL